MDLRESAENLVRIAKNAMHVIPIEQGKTYVFTPWYKHENVLMRLIATGPNFKTGQAYVFHDFVGEEKATFNTLDYKETELDRIYLFMLLPWELGEVRNRMTKVFVGPGDGEKGVMEKNSAAVISYLFSEMNMYGMVDPPPQEDTVTLPWPETEFTKPFFHSIEPKRSDNWVNITVLAPPNTDQIQKNATIHLTAGYSGDALVGLIDMNRRKTLAFELLRFRITPKMNINLTAFVHPEIIDGEFVFQLGDPEKDGTIKLQTV